MYVVVQLWTWGEVEFLTEWPEDDAKDFETIPDKDRALRLMKADAEILAQQMNEFFGDTRRSFSTEPVEAVDFSG